MKTPRGSGILRRMRRTSDEDELNARLARIKRLLDELEQASTERERQRDIVNGLLWELEHGAGERVATRVRPM